MEGYILKGCPQKLSDAWELTPVDSPLNTSNVRNRSLFSGPGLISMQSQLVNLALIVAEDHVSYLSQVGERQRQAAQTLLEVRRTALEKQRKKDGSPKKFVPEVTPIRSDEEQKLRKVVQHELDHYDLSKPDPRRNRLNPSPSLQVLTPPASPPTTNLKSILKVTGVPEDFNLKSPL